MKIKVLINIFFFIIFATLVSIAVIYMRYAILNFTILDSYYHTENAQRAAIYLTISIFCIISAILCVVIALYINKRDVKILYTSFIEKHREKKASKNAVLSKDTDCSNPDTTELKKD